MPKTAKDQQATVTQESLLQLAREIVSRLEGGTLPRKEVRQAREDARSLSRGLKQLRKRAPKKIKHGPSSNGDGNNHGNGNNH